MLWQETESLLPGLIGGSAVCSFLFALFHKLYFLACAVFFILHGLENLLRACVAQTTLLLFLFFIFLILLRAVLLILLVLLIIFVLVIVLIMLVFVLLLILFILLLILVLLLVVLILILVLILVLFLLFQLGKPQVLTRHVIARVAPKGIFIVLDSGGIIFSFICQIPSVVIGLLRKLDVLLSGNTGEYSVSGTYQRISFIGDVVAPLFYIRRRKIELSGGIVGIFLKRFLI